MHERKRLVVLLVLMGVLTADGLAQEALTPVDPATASPVVTAALGRANAALQELQTTLIGRLSAAMAAGGPAAAITVCRDEAQTLTATVGAKHGVMMGRTSDRLRNPTNAPRRWAAPTVASHAGSKVADVAPVVLDLGLRVGVLRPIGTQEFCLACHGAPESIDVSVREVLKTAYPADAAVGFSAGDLRGWMWAEVTK